MRNLQFFLILVSILAFPFGRAHACGSVAIGPIIGAFFLVLVLPAVCLIPVEVFIIKKLTELSFKESVYAYLFCLAAKIIGCFVTYLAYWSYPSYSLLFPGSEEPTIIMMEIVYSFCHLVISLLIFKTIYKFTERKLWLTSILISTAIPWSWSLISFLLSYLIYGMHLNF